MNVESFAYVSHLDVVAKDTVKISLVISLGEYVLVESQGEFSSEMKNGKLTIVADSDVTIVLPKDNCPEVNIGNVSLTMNLP